jgi:hypothetical protein
LIPSIKMIFREHLVFHATDLLSERTRETFVSSFCDDKIAGTTEKVVTDSLNLLEKNYWPEEVGIDFEVRGRMFWPDGSNEFLPISLLLSQQRPKDSRVRLGMHEIMNCSEALASITAHEMGHMLVEWIARKANVVDPNKPFMDMWCKSIYEGVADWVAAVVTGSPIVGSKKIWFNRCIFEFKSLDEARSKSVGALPILLENSLREVSLLDFRAYREWLELVKKHLGCKPNPYAEGQWVAGELWRISNEGANAKTVFEAISEQIVSGRKVNDPTEFIYLLSTRL